jgi:hypothetical protein
VNSIDLNTVLIGIVLAISGWTLQTVLKLSKSVTEMETTLWGKDGNSGLVGEIHRMRADIREGADAFNQSLAARAARPSRRVEYPDE